MIISKRSLCDLDECYSVAVITQNCRDNVLFASEGRRPCYIFDIKTFSRQTVWEGPGGG
jgi:hypothetical protein